MVMAACERPEIIRETPSAVTDHQPAPSPTSRPLPTSSFTVPDDTGYSIDRITLATSVDDSGEPRQETSVIPQSAERFFLCVRVENIEPGAQFRAYWLEGDQVIGQSDRISTETKGRATWVALEYRPVAELNPSSSYAVELLINDVRIDRYLFRVGSGNPEDVVAEAGFATGFDAQGDLVGTLARFPSSTETLALRVRVSSRVDPSPLSFSTLWFREETQFAQLAPDPPETSAVASIPGGTPGTTPTPSADPRRLRFTYRPSGPLIPGDYRVVLLLNGTEVRSIPFVVTGSAASGGVEPGETRTGDNSEARETNATVEEMMVTSEVDPASNAPIDGRVYVWQEAEGSSVELWVALDVRDLVVDDVVEVMIWRDNQLFASERLPAAEVGEGWIAHPFDFAVPQFRQGSADYLAAVLINGNRLLEAGFEMVPIPD